MTATLSPPRTQCAHERARRHLSWWLKGLEIVALILLAVAFLECFFFMNAVGEQEYRFPDLTLGWTYPPGKIIGYRREGFSRDKINSAGMRDHEHTLRKPPGVFRIALLGDSATAALQVPMESTTARLLEKSLNTRSAKLHAVRRFEVLNFGCVGYSTAQELVQYEHVVSQYHPDVVIIMYTAGDAGESVLPLADRVNAPPRPYFYLDRQGTLKEDRSLIALNADRFFKINPFLDFLMYHSRIFGILCQTDFEMSMNEPHYRLLRNWFTRKFGPRPSKVSPDMVPEPYLVPDTAVIGTAMLKRLNQSVKADGGRLVLAVFPNAFKVREFYKDAAAFAAMSTSEHFAYIDLDAPYRRHADPSSLILEQHFSAGGHRFATQELLTVLEPICFDRQPSGQK